MSTYLENEHFYLNLKLDSTEPKAKAKYYE